MTADLEQMLQNDRFLEILDRAAAIYSRSSYEATGIRELAAALDIKSASLYHYFSCKEDILYAIMWKTHSRFLAEITPVADSAGTPQEVMQRLVEAHIRFDARCWNDVAVSGRERNSLSSERRSVINNFRRQYRDMVARVVSLGAEPGSWAAREPVIVASTILDMVNGLVEWYRPRGEADLAHIIEIYADNAVALMNVLCDIAQKTLQDVAPLPARQSA